MIIILYGKHDDNPSQTTGRNNYFENILIDLYSKRLY